MRDFPLWTEELQRHRQPTLYYIEDEEAVDGPHLIVNWNGIQTEPTEIDIALSYNEVSQQQSCDAIAKVDGAIECPYEAIDVSTNDCLNPTTELAKTFRTPDTQISLALNKSELFDFISVPFITSGLLKRIVRNAKQHQENRETREL